MYIRRVLKRKGYPREARDNPEFLEVLGRLAVEGLSFGDEPAVPWREPVTVDAVIAAGEVEPRLLAALPALLWKRPRMFTSLRGLPGDLAEAVHELKRGGRAEFAGHGAGALRAWVKKLERASKKTSRLKAFRFTDADQALLLELADELGLSETDVIRHALRVLSARQG